MGDASIADVLAYIDDRYEAMLEKPKMFASNPMALEELLRQLEDLREFAVTGEWNFAMRRGYSRFLGNIGFGVAMATTRYIEQGVTDTSELFKMVVSTWRRFLSSPFRISGD